MLKYIFAAAATELRTLNPPQMNALIALYRGNYNNRVSTINDLLSLTELVGPRWSLSAAIAAVDCMISCLDKIEN